MQLHDLVPVDNRWVLVMSLESGSPLSALGELNRPKRVLADLLEGLAQLHSRGLSHGDVSPANVLVDEGGRASLIDIDIAQTRLGTAKYASPSEEDSPARDIYGWGKICEELGFDSHGATNADPEERPVAGQLLELYKDEGTSAQDCLDPAQELRTIGMLDAVTQAPAKRAKPHWSLISVGVVMVCVGVGLALGTAITANTDTAAAVKEQKDSQKVTEGLKTPSSEQRKEPKRVRSIKPQPAPSVETQQQSAPPETDLAPGNATLAEMLARRARAIEKMDKKSLAEVSFPESPSQKADLDLFARLQAAGVRAKGVTVTVANEEKQGSTIEATIVQSAHEQCSQSCRKVESTKYKAVFEIRDGKIFSVVRK